MRHVNQEIIFFPGSIEEYQRWAEHSVEIVETGYNDKGLTIAFTSSCKKQETNNYLISDNDLNNIEALVNVQRNTRHPFTITTYYGLPVRKKQGGPYR